MEGTLVKMTVGRKEKTKMSQYLSENTKTGNFNAQMPFSRSFFVILKHLVSIRAVGLAFTANKQTNKHSHYIYTYT